MIKDIRTLNKKKISLSEIEKFYKINSSDYKKLYDTVLVLINQDILKPVAASKRNGKSPALFLNYWVKLIEEDDSEYFDEIKFKLYTKFNTDYYLKNISKYKEDRDAVLMLNEFFLSHSDKLKNIISLNERSFEIWGKEKFLGRQGGKRILKNLGIDEEVLNFYGTREPLAYYAKSKETPQNILIIENKDTFYSMRKYILEGSNEIFGVEIGTVVYGAGKNIDKTFADLEFCVESYVSNRNNTVLYFGDLDYEGIIIYESMKKIFKDKYNIHPFKEGYIAMLDKYEKMKINLPKTKEGQNRNILDVFLGEFKPVYRQAMLKILTADEYIPQEILNIGDF
jgi:hypothetical protein